MYSRDLEFAFGAAMVGFVLIVLAISLTIAILYLMNLQNLMKEVNQKNRQVEPGNVWLMLIPLFNIIYPFILYPKICDSVKAEFEFRGKPETGDYGRALGITMPILGLVGFVPFLGTFAGLANLVIFIIFWVKMAEYKNKLRNMPKTGDGLSSSSDLID
ncbi:MAG: hypothetical protein EP305_09910 [Bacteroidetes bacterium]|nr:MAG: hypothetical protein EP305_09910 [Bacteroidota bacterium]